MPVLSKDCIGQLEQNIIERLDFLVDVFTPTNTISCSRLFHHYSTHTHTNTHTHTTHTGMKKYLYKGAIEEGPMVTFMDDFFAGKIEAYLKSEKVRLKPL